MRKESNTLSYVALCMDAETETETQKNIEMQRQGHRQAQKDTETETGNLSSKPFSLRHVHSSLHLLIVLLHYAHAHIEVLVICCS